MYVRAMQCNDNDNACNGMDSEGKTCKGNEYKGKKCNAKASKGKAFKDNEYIGKA
jgi:hypothetical protein